MNLAEWSLKLKSRSRRTGGRTRLPPLLFLTDRKRVPDPERAILRLPKGSGVILRDYKAKKRAKMARRLAHLCRKRHLVFLVAGDPALARRVRADGIHLRERQMKRAMPRHNPRWLVTAAAHSPKAMRQAANRGVDAVLVSPVFATGSHPKKKPLGVRRLAQWTGLSPLPAYALGGIDVKKARALARANIAGVAAISAFAER